MSLNKPTAGELREAPRGANADGLFVTVSSSVDTQPEALRAEWQAQMLISAIWRTSSLKGLTPISGGMLVDDAIADSETQSAGTWFTEDENDKRYKASDGVSSSVTPVAASLLTGAVEGRAKATEANVAKIEFGNLIGTSVSVDLQVADPEKWQNALGLGSVLGTVDIRSLEGVFVTVRDGRGNLVKATSFSTGFEAGAAVYGADYERPPFVQVAGGATTPAANSATP